MDETGFSHKPHLRGAWAPRGRPLVIRHRFNWKRWSVIAVVGRKRAVFRILPHGVKWPDVAAFLWAVLRQVRGKMVVVLDGLPAHRTSLVGQAEEESRGRLKLEWLPGYAPELNATEYLWGHTKGRLANRAVLDNEALLGQTRSQLRSTQRRPNLLKSFWKQTGLAWP
ncbi:MAG: transposase [Candidatus Methylacidiphilales bacterium]|nr:transposase [Candidatus Methylacidiphilales bacterium]